MKSHHVTLKILKKIDDEMSESTKFMNPGKVKNITKSVELPNAVDDAQSISRACQTVIEQKNLKFITFSCST